MYIKYSKDFQRQGFTINLLHTLKTFNLQALKLYCLNMTVAASLKTSTLQFCSFISFRARKRNSA